ncbi:hypothetical protein BCR35DRAFT_300194 [Leucosporidium creatinivorum]|uniref:MYND-type domain-containing protein n=1 Tax=Leucosporidium creatinivorum TaxID=106004 RepID=A0A1Y2G002_9BASI|nr:hypothetical protein BCR35DRAFT_300194 [Leucosporidium creatinivorum]
MSDSGRMQLMMRIMMEEAQLSKGLTKEQNEHRIKMEKIGWEQEDRAKLGMCRWYDCEQPEGTTLFACACHAPDIRYCSPECQKEDWKLQHKNLCSTRKSKKAEK